MKVLKSQEIQISSKFKLLTKQSFYLVRIGSSDSIYLEKTNLPLVTHERLFEKISLCYTDVGHSGRDKT